MVSCSDGSVEITALIKYKGIIKQCLADLYPLTIEERNYGMGSLKDNDLNTKGPEKIR